MERRGGISRKGQKWGVLSEPRLRPPGEPGNPFRAFGIFWTERNAKGKARSCRLSTGTTDPGLAQDFFIRWQAERLKPPKVVTVDALLDTYLDDRRREGAKTIANMTLFAKQVRAHFGSLEPEQIHPNLVRDYHTRRRRTVSDRTVAAELVVLRSALKFGEQEQLIERAPFIRLPKNAGNRARNRYLTKAEITALMRATQAFETAPHIRLFVILSLVTGQRSIAIKSLRWDHVDFERGVIWFSKTDPNPSPNKRRPDQMMIPALAHVLQEAKAVAETEWVIEFRGGPVADVKKGFAALIARAGLEDVHVHDLRRTVMSQGRQAGFDARQVGGHSGAHERIVEAHYGFLSPETGLPVAEHMAQLAGLPKPENENGA